MSVAAARVCSVLLGCQSNDEVLQRYGKQKLFLKQCGMTRLTYLIEGDIDAIQGSTNPKRLRAEIHKTFLEGFVIQQTKGILDTARWLLSAALTLLLSLCYSHAAALTLLPSLCYSLTLVLSHPSRSTTTLQ